MIVGQIVPDVGNVRTDQVGVVQQPLGGMGDSVIQPRGFGQIGPRTLDCNFALSQDRQQRPRFRGWISVRCEAASSAAQSGKLAIVTGSRSVSSVWLRRSESNAWTNRKYGRMRDMPQDRNDIRRALFRLLDNDKALSRKHETAVVAKNFLLESESQPERAEPGDQKAAQRQEDQRPRIRPEELRPAEQGRAPSAIPNAARR